LINLAAKQDEDDEIASGYVFYASCIAPRALGFETFDALGETVREAHRHGLKIELKVGTCPPGALEQAQGYAEAIEAKEGKPARAIVIAQNFSDRVQSAARRMRDLELHTYEFQLRFQPVT
jgi:hypothetical protein